MHGISDCVIRLGAGGGGCGEDREDEDEEYRNRGCDSGVLKCAGGGGGN